MIMMFTKTHSRLHVAGGRAKGNPSVLPATPSSFVRRVFLLFLVQVPAIKIVFKV